MDKITDESLYQEGYRDGWRGAVTRRLPMLLVIIGLCIIAGIVIGLAITRHLV